MSDQRQKSIVRHTCERCFKTWRQKESFLKHLENCKGDGSAPEYRCDKCLRTFVYGRCFRNHECKGLSRINTCRFCNKKYVSQAYFDKHVKICGKRSTSNNDPAPQPSQMKTCPFCKRNYVRRVCFDKHVEICGKRDRWLTSKGDDPAPPPEYRCDKCLRTFACRSSLGKHKCKGDDSRMKTCRFCKKNYVSQVCFDRHVEKCGKLDRS